MQLQAGAVTDDRKRGFKEEATTITIRRPTRERLRSKKITNGQSFDEAVTLLLDAFEAHVGKDAKLLPGGS